MLKKLTIVLGMAVAVAGTTTVSSFVFVPEAHAGWYKKAKKAAKKAALKTVNGIAKVGEYEVRGAHKVGRGAKRAGKVAGSVGKGYGRMGKCAVKRNCKNTIGPGIHDHRS
jgi:hypothetical protein